ncbi:MAG: helix-turn-helix domain-containing protein [Planctomycetota bacterium]|nr:helix-turn-helix domain-containing protein [Planctomycetota bacterium]
MANVQETSRVANPAELMAVGELARRLRVSVRQAHRMNKAGLIPRPLRIGGVVRWREDEISRWLQSGAPVRSAWEKQGATQTVGGQDT